MFSRNDYWAYLSRSPDDLAHYGVKGMKWGVRHDYVPTGEYRYIHRRRGTRPRTNNRLAKGSIQRRKVSNRRKILKGSAIAIGTVLAAYGGYKSAKFLKSEAGQRLISNGKRQFMNKFYQAQNVSRNIRRTGGNARRVVSSSIRANPVGRVASNVLSAPRRLIGGSQVGRILIKTYGAAVTVSDLSSTYQYAKRVKKEGITKKNTKEYAKDIINPIPNNIPGLNKKKKSK